MGHSVIKIQNYMNQKLTFQLVAPFIISALLFAVFWIVGFIFGMSGKIFNVITLIDIGNFFAVNPFKIEGRCVFSMF